MLTSRAMSFGLASTLNNCLRDLVAIALSRATDIKRRAKRTIGMQMAAWANIANSSGDNFKTLFRRRISLLTVAARLVLRQVKTVNSPTVLGEERKA